MKKKIMFVDDEMPILNSIKRLLRKENYEIILANGPQEALGMIKSVSPDVIVSDFRMPGVNGVEFIGKARELVPSIKCAILSGYADEKVIAKALETGQITKYLFKPWEDEALKNEIRNLAA